MTCPSFASSFPISLMSCAFLCGLIVSVVVKYSNPPAFATSKVFESLIRKHMSQRRPPSGQPSRSCDLTAPVNLSGSYSPSIISNAASDFEPYPSGIPGTEMMRDRR